jgi:hypothetical protein
MKCPIGYHLFYRFDAFGQISHGWTIGESNISEANTSINLFESSWVEIKEYAGLVENKERVGD